MNGLILLLAVLAWNAALVLVIVSSRDFVPLLVVIAAALLLLPFGKATYDAIKGPKINVALYLGLLGTSLLWLPIYLLAITRRSAASGIWFQIENLATWLGVALLVLFAFAVGRRFQDRHQG